MFQDGDFYRMYYDAAHWQGLGDHAHPRYICYAESTDGINWTRPTLGLVEFEGSKNNNIIMPAEGVQAFIPFKDANPNCKPHEQCKALAVLATVIERAGKAVRLRFVIKDADLYAFGFGK